MSNTRMAPTKPAVCPNLNRGLISESTGGGQAMNPLSLLAGALSLSLVAGGALLLPFRQHERLSALRAGLAESQRLSCPAVEGDVDASPGAEVVSG